MPPVTTAKRIFNLQSQKLLRQTEQAVRALLAASSFVSLRTILDAAQHPHGIEPQLTGQMNCCAAS
jgi:hypothetical protein